MGLFREVASKGGGGFVRLIKVLTCSGTSGVAIWGGDLGDVGCNVQKIECMHVVFLRQVTEKKEKRQKEGSGQKVDS